MKTKAATVLGNGQKLFQPSNSLLKKAWFVSGHRFSGVVTGPQLLAALGAEAAQRGFAANCLGAGFSSLVN
jgi:hypothetical protein